MNKEEKFLDEVRRSISEAGDVKKPHRPFFKRTRILGKLSPTGIIILASAVALGMLTGLLFTVFTVTMTGDVTLEGKMSPLFEFDGILFETETIALDADITHLDSGTTQNYTHWVINRDEGAWDVVVDLGDLSFYNDPPHEFYGLNISITDWEVNGEPTDQIYILPGDTLSFNLSYSLHHEFVTTETPYPLAITVTLTRTPSEPIEADPVIVDLPFNTVTTYDVILLSNAVDPENDPITLIAIGPDTNPFQKSIVDNKIQLQYGSGQAGTYEMWFKLTDGTTVVTVPMTVHYLGE